MRLRRNLQNADLFRRVPKDLTEATTPGAIISLVCMTIMVLLFLGEVRSYVAPRTQSDMLVSPDYGGEKLHVSLDITFHHFPCSLLSLDILDILGNHELNSMKHVKRTRLTAQGKIIDGKPDEPGSNDEGCRIKGFIFVAKVPGNFHISAHSRVHDANTRFPGGLRLQHTIHHLSFGEYDVRKLSQAHLLHPLDGAKSLAGGHRTWEYFLDIVPTTYEGNIVSTHTYQFTANNHSTVTHAHGMASVTFRYQISPITVRYYPYRPSFSHFLTYICAIVGGVFTVAGLVSRFVLTSTAQVQKHVFGKVD